MSAMLCFSLIHNVCFSTKLSNWFHTTWCCFFSLNPTYKVINSFRPEANPCPHLPKRGLINANIYKCDSTARTPRWQPTRLPRPWDSPSKNSGVGCRFLLQCMKVKSESEVAQSLRDPMDCSLLGSSIHGIFQARVLEWGAIAISTNTKEKRKKVPIIFYTQLKINNRM